MNSNNSYYHLPTTPTAQLVVAGVGCVKGMLYGIKNGTVAGLAYGYTHAYAIGKNSMAYLNS